jgi:hypothetical protein
MLAMSAGCWRVKPSEVERTLKSIQKAGLHIRSVEVCAQGVKINVTENEAEPDATTSICSTPAALHDPRRNWQDRRAG